MLINQLIDIFWIQLQKIHNNVVFEVKKLAKRGKGRSFSEGGKNHF